MSRLPQVVWHGVEPKRLGAPRVVLDIKFVVICLRCGDICELAGGDSIRISTRVHFKWASLGWAQVESNLQMREGEPLQDTVRENCTAMEAYRKRPDGWCATTGLPLLLPNGSGHAIGKQLECFHDRTRDIE